MKRTAATFMVCFLYFLLAGGAIGYGDTADDLFARANRYRDRSEYSLAIETFQEVISIRPDAFEAYTNIGLCYSATGDYRNAIANYRQAVEINPEDAVALGGMGSAYFHLKEYQPAAESFQRAVAIDPTNPYYHDGLGFNLGLLGQNEAGLKSLRRAVELYRQRGDYERTLVLEEMIATLTTALREIEGWELMGNEYNGLELPEVEVFGKIEYDAACREVRVSRKTVCTTDSCPLMDSIREFCMVWTCDGPYQGKKEQGIPVKYELTSYLVDCREQKDRQLGTEWYGLDQALIGRSRRPDADWTDFPGEDDEQRAEIDQACSQCPR